MYYVLAATYSQTVPEARGLVSSPEGQHKPYELYFILTVLHLISFPHLLPSLPSSPSLSSLISFPLFPHLLPSLPSSPSLSSLISFPLFPHLLPLLPSSPSLSSLISFPLFPLLPPLGPHLSFPLATLCDGPRRKSRKPLVTVQEEMFTTELPTVRYKGLYVPPCVHGSTLCMRFEKIWLLCLMSPTHSIYVGG